MVSVLAVLDRDVHAIVSCYDERSLRVNDLGLGRLVTSIFEIVRAMRLESAAIASRELQEEPQLASSLSLHDFIAIHNDVDARHQSLKAGEQAAAHARRPLEMGL